jgi:hypothetical protein
MDLEKYALAEDRAAALAELTPGSDDYYFHHCLEAQHQGRLEEVDRLVKTWVERHGSSGQVRQILHRQALLRHASSPKACLDYLRRELDLHLDHQPEAETREAPLPSRLDPGLHARAALCARELRERIDLQGFEDRALRWLPGEELGPDRRRQLLQRLRAPDHPRLPELVLADLDQRGSGGFGSLAIHALLTREQLAALGQARPALWQDSGYVGACLRQLRPDGDTEWEHDIQARQRVLDGYWEFAARLSPAFNSLKAHVLYHRLELDRSLGRVDRARLLTYLALPRAAGYVAPEFLERGDRRRHQADLSADFRSLTGLGPVGSDQALVDACLAELMLADGAVGAFAEFVREEHLRRLLAETRLLAGRGDLEADAAMLDDPARLEELRERVDLEFAPENPRVHGAAEPVRLDVYVKNVAHLVLKVFEIDAAAYFRAHGREVDASIDLDGLVASHEETFTYREPPLRRVRRTFELPGLDRPGVYVAELIGNGRASRAVVRKGSLAATERLTAGGHLLQVLDGEHQPVADASLWLAGREYHPRKAEGDGPAGILVPYSTQPGRVVALLKHGDLAVPFAFEHRAEHYRLTAGLYAERERLLAGREASVLVRPALELHGAPLSVRLLEKACLTIESLDGQGKRASLDVPELVFEPGRDLVHRFRTPPDLRSITFRLKAEVKSLSRGERVELSDERTYTLNGIDDTSRVMDAHLARTRAGHVLYLLGKTGEPRPGLGVNLGLKHRDFRRELEVSLRTDSAGRIELGELEEIEALSITSPDGASQRFPLPRDRVRLPAQVHALEGELIELPLPATPASLDHEHFGLLERRGEAFLADRRESLRAEPGRLLLSGLPAGAYRLWLKEQDEVVDIEVARGVEAAGWAATATRLVELRRGPALGVAEVSLGKTQLGVRLLQAGPGTRVVAVASRFLPAHDLLDDLGEPAPPPPRALRLERPRTAYQSGRDIGDEYRYVLDRKAARKYPGSMLERPGLLLNPWPVRKTTTSVAEALGGEGYASESLAAPRPSAPAARRARQATAAITASPDLDFLAEPAACFWDLVPDAEGWVRLPSQALEPHNLVRFLATRGSQAVSLSVPLSESATPHRDLRLLAGLDPREHLVERKQACELLPGQSLEIADLATADLERFDSLKRVFGLFRALSGEAGLEEFSWLLDWPELSPEERLRLVSQHACHELHFFLAHKDPAFFEQVLRPYLENKREQTFLDHFLMGQDLSRYLEPWAFSQLNAAEQALLARRLPARREDLRRHLQDRVELTPRDAAREDRLFAAALGSGALRADDDGGLAQARGRARDLAKAKRAARPSTGSAMPAIALGMQAPAPPAEAPADYELDECRSAKCAEASLDDDLVLRAEAQPLFQAVEKTEEWAENQYHHIPLERLGPELIGPNRFWLDVAAHEGGRPFLSTHLAEATSCLAEMLLALGLLDLPFQAEPPEMRFEGAGMTLTCRMPALVLHQSIQPATATRLESGVLLSQHLIRADDRTRLQDGYEVDRYVTGELLPHVVYLAQTVVTNTTSAPLNLELLLQAPEGSLPVAKGFATRSFRLQVEPHGSERLEHAFYFPAPGEFPHYPPHASSQGELVAAAEPEVRRVVAEPATVDRTDWGWLSQRAEADELLAYLETANLARLELERMAWRMRNRKFYDRCLKLFRRRQAFHPALWAYALRHQDSQAAGELLRHQEDFLRECGPYLRCDLVDIDPRARRWYQHLEYAPFINARAHRLGARHRILNDRLNEQWTRFLEVMRLRPALDDQDWLEACYYLLLQDRIGEALEAFDRVDPRQVTERLQFAYLGAVVALLREQPGRARELAAPHREHPVVRWRRLFQAVLAQLDEAEGGAPGVVDEDSRDQRQAGLAAAEPAFDFEILGQKLRLHHQNLRQARLHVYLMDIELRFSRQPFVEQGVGAFGFIKPNHTLTLELPAGAGTTEVELPAALATANAVVEVVAAGLQKSLAHYAHDLVVQLSEAYGQLRVHQKSDQTPRQRAYVKVYARMQGGREVFYKDGYTDLRGRFDYASLSTDELDRVERFAILVLDESCGAVIREAPPPKR